MSRHPYLGIVNANRLTVQHAAVPTPYVRGTLIGWFRKLDLTRVIKTQVEFEIKEVLEPLTTMGMVQPLSARRLEMKPEGQRAWEWKLLHCAPDLILKPDDVVIYQGTHYRIEGQTSYAEYGAVEYELVNDYTRSSRI